MTDKNSFHSKKMSITGSCSPGKEEFVTVTVIKQEIREVHSLLLFPQIVAPEKRNHNLVSVCLILADKVQPVA